MKSEPSHLSTEGGDSAGESFPVPEVGKRASRETSRPHRHDQTH